MDKVNEFEDSDYARAGKIIKKIRDDLKNEMEAIDVSIDCLLEEIQAKRKRRIACEKALTSIPAFVDK